MWFPERYKALKAVDVSGLLETLQGLDESHWYADDTLKTRLAGQRPTQSIFLLNLHEDVFAQILLARRLQTSDVKQEKGWGLLHEQVLPVVEHILEAYPPGGVITRLQLARLPSGCSIDKHFDLGYILRMSHRIHVPLITNPGVEFIVEDESIPLPVGQAFELNNRLAHEVHNRGEDDRIHLLFDYLPPWHNHFSLLSNREERFMHKTSLKPDSLPTVIATSVVRGAQKHQSHGGIYLINFEKEAVQQVLDWDTCDIDFQGRGWDRGLRGIAFFGTHTLIMASDELFGFDTEFKQVFSYKNPYLKHAHEVCIYGHHLYITSTGFDSIIRFNLEAKVFDLAWHIRLIDQHLGIQVFDPTESNGPSFSNTLHLNNVFCNAEGIYFSGKNFPALALIKPNEQSLHLLAELPMGTHNARPYQDGIIFNDTARHRVCWRKNGKEVSIPVPYIEPDKLENTHLSSELARQGFARGLCPYKENQLFVGSSPSTISLIDVKEAVVKRHVTFSHDICNAIHGLAIWSLN